MATTCRGWVGSPLPPTTTGRPRSSGWRRTSTAARNSSRSTCRNHRVIDRQCAWTDAAVRGQRRWDYSFVMTEMRALPVVPPSAAGGERSRPPAAVLLAALPAVGLGGAPAGPRARAERRRVGDRPSGARRVARSALRLGVRGGGHRRRPRRIAVATGATSCAACSIGCSTPPDPWRPTNSPHPQHHPQFRHDEIRRS